MTIPKKPSLAAEAAYVNAHMAARDLIHRLRDLLTDMPATGDDEHPINWGHVGDISHVNALLVQAVTFLDRTGK